MIIRKKTFSRRSKRKKSRRARSGSMGRLILTDGIFAVERGDPAWRIKYETYMSSDAWRETRRNFKQVSGGPLKCAACGSNDQIAIHHRTYERLGAERMDDLVALCVMCHQGVHDLHRSRKYSIEEATDRVLTQDRPMGQPQLRSESPKFVPANKRGAKRLPDGRLISSLDWRDESRSIRGLTNDWDIDD